MQTSWYFVATNCLHIFSYLRSKIQSNYHEMMLKKEQNAIDQGKLINPSRYLLMATAFPDWIAMCFYYAALLYIPASITEMLRSGIVIFVALFSVIFLKKRFDRSEAVGIIVLFIGMLLVGWAGLDDYSDDGKDTQQIWLGIFFLTLSMIFDGLFFVIVEKFYNVYHINPTAMAS